MFSKNVGEGEQLTHVLLLLEGKIVWNIPLFVSLLSLALVYAWFISRKTTLKLYQHQPLLFFLGLSLLYVTYGSPLSAFGHLSFSAHMFQMSILYFMVPPLLLLGMSNLPLPGRISSHLVKMLSKLIVKPVVTLTSFAILFFFYHLPMVLTTLSKTPLMQYGYILFLFFLSLAMWWPIIAPTHQEHFNPEQKKRYALLSGVLLLPSCLLFILNSLLDGMSNPFLAQLTVMLCLPAQFNAFDLLPFSFNTRLDQFMGGVLMLGMHKIGLALTFLLGEKLSVP